jgi:tryptophanyl-tRNA synthetase
LIFLKHFNSYPKNRRKLMKNTILSGIRATGRLHFGNYLGAVQNFVNFQRPENQCFYFVADWHTLTTLKETQHLQTNLIEMVKDYIAAGLDPEQSTIYAQSSVPEIAELSLYLGMVQPLGDLQRTPTFKELARKHPDNVNLGTISYPVLMAADILGPRANIVPVGEDQIPNVEMARELARRFNKLFGNIFIIPDMLENMVRVPGLDGDKMGKSESDNAIDINSDVDEIARRYRSRGITDTQRVRSNDPGDPLNRCKSVYPVHELVTEHEKETRRIAELCKGGMISCSECKKLLVGNIAKVLVPFQERRMDLAPKDAAIREMLHEGGKRARRVISNTTAMAREAIGIKAY